MHFELHGTKYRPFASNPTTTQDGWSAYTCISCNVGASSGFGYLLNDLGNPFQEGIAPGASSSNFFFTVSGGNSFPDGTSNTIFLPSHSTFSFLRLLWLAQSPTEQAIQSSSPKLFGPAFAGLPMGPAIRLFSEKLYQFPTPPLALAFPV